MSDVKIPSEKDMHQVKWFLISISIILFIIGYALLSWKTCIGVIALIFVTRCRDFYKRYSENIAIVKLMEKDKL